MCSILIIKTEARDGDLLVYASSFVIMVNGLGINKMLKICFFPIQINTVIFVDQILRHAYVLHYYWYCHKGCVVQFAYWTYTLNIQQIYEFASVSLYKNHFTVSTDNVEATFNECVILIYLYDEITLGANIFRKLIELDENKPSLFLVKTNLIQFVGDVNGVCVCALVYFWPLSQRNKWKKWKTTKIMAQTK